MILGIEDFWVAAAYILCILSSLLCVVYGILNWNKGEQVPSDTDVAWGKKEMEIEEEL